jgi:hypothetical protein
MTTEHRQRLKEIIKFQKTLALFASASNAHEAKAAELAARRVMEACNIDPVVIPDRAFTSHMNFADNALLNTLREEWREAHPDYWYSKPDSYGHVRRLRGKPRRVNTKPVNRYEGLFDDYRLFDDFAEAVNTMPKAKPKPTAESVNTKPGKASPDDRNRDRHSPGYMREYMRKRRAAKHQP